MSRVFRRPMFRKGGGVNMNGIMSGIEDRQNFSTGTEQTLADLPSIKDLTAENIAALQEAGGDRAGYDPLTSFLLQYGPALATQTGGGGTLGNIVAAAKDPVASMLQDKRREDQYQRELRTQAAGAAIKQASDMRSAFEDRKFQKGMAEDDRQFQTTMKNEDRKFTEKMSKLEFDRQKNLITDEREYNKLLLEDQRLYNEGIRDEAREYEKMTLKEQREYEDKLIKEGREFELQKIQEEIKGRKDIKQMEIDALDSSKDEDLKSSYRDFYEGSENQVSNRLKYEKNNFENQMNEKFGQNNAGLIGGMHGDMKDQIKSKNVGKVYYDVTDGKVKQVTRSSDGELGFTVIDLQTYNPDQTSTTTTTSKKGITQKDKDRIKDAYGFYLPEVIDKLQEKDKEIPFGGTGA
jgi:hypothetical protein